MPETHGETMKGLSPTITLSPLPPLSDDHGETRVSLSPIHCMSPRSSTGNDGETLRGLSSMRVMSPLIAEIRETHRQRVDLMRARIRLTNQQFAIHCRLHPDDPRCQAKARERERWLRAQQDTTGDDHDDAGTQSIGVAPNTPESNGRRWFATQPASAVASEVGPAEALTDLATLYLQQAEAAVVVGERDLEKRLRKLARQLPVWPWVESVPGFGDLGLAQIVGEAGDLANYPNPAKLWKRMGVAVIGDERQRKVSGADALDHGYSPQRRSLLWVIGDSLLKKAGPYRDIYLAEKARQAELHPELSRMHVHLRAKRYMEKRLLRDLWRAWRRADAG